MIRNELEKPSEYKVVEWRVIAVWNDGLVEDWSDEFADDSTIAIEVDCYCRDYEELRNENPEEYNESKW